MWSVEPDGNLWQRCDREPAWRKLTELPEVITSIGMRDWAHVGHRLV
jgi:hypothetical protein